jgi:hypothetical protein
MQPSNTRRHPINIIAELLSKIFAKYISTEIVDEITMALGISLSRNGYLKFPSGKQFIQLCHKSDRIKKCIFTSIQCYSPKTMSMEV